MKSCLPIWIHEWLKKFSETSMLENKHFEISQIYLLTIMEDITDADYAHAKRVCKDFEIK